MAWKPMGAAANFHDTLHPGVPIWMVPPLVRWLDGHYDSSELEVRCELFDAMSRSTSLIAPTVRDYGSHYFLANQDGDTIIRFLDFLVFSDGLKSQGSDGPYSVARLAALDLRLGLAGSAWKVGTRDDHWGLERRVPEGVQEAADRVVTTTGSAGRLLAEAWHAAFGVNPDPEEAYEKAIKAVEEAGAKVVLPKNPKATLGTMIATMRPHGDWVLEITDSNGARFGDVVLNMCEALWQGQPSRHGGNGYRKPTQGEAEAAVMLAVPLVQWFHSGAVARRP